MKFLKTIIIVLFLLFGLRLFYTSSLIGVNTKSKSYLKTLKKELKNKGYEPNLFVISGRRWYLDNLLLNKFGGASSKSRHLKGEAIDIIVLDVNNDGQRNALDVNIVYDILDKKIIKNNGGLGSYKNERGFFNKQMIHFDSSRKKARWNR